MTTQEYYMKNKYLYLWLVPLIGIGIVVFLDQAYWQKWQQHVRFLRGTVERGIMIQMTVDEFEKQVGRYPVYSEFTNVYSFIGSFQEGVTPHTTNKVTSAFDNSDGWFYDEKSGEVRINYSGKYVIGFQSWVVDLSQIKFRPQTRIETMHFGRLKTLDYSYFNERVEACRPQIEEIVKNWAATNTVRISQTNSEGLKK
jgi:hypothetical protein